MLVSHYDHILVVTSFVVAILASSTALNMAGRVTTSSGSAARIWLVGGSVAMGIGIWAMHFIGMLAMSLPVTLSYDPLITAASLLIAIGSALFALWLVCGAELKVSRLIPGSLVLGCGIAAMHYTGMAALLVEPGIVWAWGWVALSIVIALLASVAALWLTFRLRQDVGNVALMRAGAAIIMGIAIAGMHYTGMMAANFQAIRTPHIWASTPAGWRWS